MFKQDPATLFTADEKAEAVEAIYDESPQLTEFVSDSLIPQRAIHPSIKPSSVQAATLAKQRAIRKAKNRLRSKARRAHRK